MPVKTRRCKSGFDQKLIKSEIVSVLSSFCQDHKLNFHKLMCLRWQNKSGKNCTNKNHKNDIYKNELECEASMTEILAMTFETFGATKEDALKFIKNIENSCN